jgi:hypothetical protein
MMVVSTSKTREVAVGLPITIEASGLDRVIVPEAPPTELTEPPPPPGATALIILFRFTEPPIH